jgi:hypothetical protein
MAASQRIIEHELCLREALSVLQQINPILSSFIDEHCATFLPGLISEDDAIALFSEYGHRVDKLVIEILSDAGLNVDETAAALYFMREATEERPNPALLSHLLAVESFDRFQEVMIDRNLELHLATRKELAKAKSSEQKLPAPENPRSQTRTLFSSARVPLLQTRLAQAMREAARCERGEQAEVDAALVGEGGGASKDAPMSSRRVAAAPRDRGGIGNTAYYM